MALLPGPLAALVPAETLSTMTPDEIIAEYPQLTPEDIQAALAYAAEALHSEILVPLAG